MPTGNDQFWVNPANPGLTTPSMIAPPVDLHPELVLAAVIADRRRRDAIRLERDAALRRRLIPADPIDSQSSSRRANRE